MQLRTRLECVGSSPRVSGACQDSAREFIGRRPRLTGRLSGVAKKLARIVPLDCVSLEVYGDDVDHGSIWSLVEAKIPFSVLGPPRRISFSHGVSDN
ncbi:hypothetical protein B296_00043250 [Ensete ventricosum]|uniref:Uncharacterized protein n=1 Tax=Ensete ventricosum TaxID=4639 RepID=A0A426Z5P0_ENSVE|nr:hypothetical protein B296_00043250 [Ensete ventricosum]